MRIGPVRRETTEDGVRQSAEVLFEETDRAPVDVWFEVDRADEDALGDGADPFLLAAVPAACYAGERRVRVDSRACSVLRRNLEAVARVLSTWYPRGPEVVLEAGGGFSPSRPRPERRTGALLSGGVDSLSMLAENREDLPLDHPDSIREAVFVFGLHRHDFEGGVPAPPRREAFHRQAARLRRLGDLVGFRLLPVRTNLTALYPDFQAWLDAGHGAGTVAPGLALAPRITDLLLASHGTGLSVPPHGTHPLLYGHLGSAAVRVRVGQVYATRLEKTARLAAWDVLLPFLSSCVQHEPLADGRLNCGRCEKCVRTMLGLLACDALEKTNAFGAHDVTPERVRAVTVRGHLPLFYPEALLGLLAARGRGDLVAALRERIVPIGEGPVGRLLRHLRRLRSRLERPSPGGQAGSSQGGLPLP